MAHLYTVVEPPVWTESVRKVAVDDNRHLKGRVVVGGVSCKEEKGQERDETRSLRKGADPRNEKKCQIAIQRAVKMWPPASSWRSRLWVWVVKNRPGPVYSFVKRVPAPIRRDFRCEEH